MFALWYLNGGDFVQRAVERAAVNDGSGGCRVGLAADCHSVRLLQSGLTGKEPGNKKPSPLLENIEEGTRAIVQILPWCHPVCLPSSIERKDHFSRLFSCVGTTHLFLLASRTRRLSSASRSRMRSERAMPFRTSTLLRIAVGGPPHTTFAQRGSVCMKFTLVSIPA